MQFRNIHSEQKGLKELFFEKEEMVVSWDVNEVVDRHYTRKLYRGAQM